MSRYIPEVQHINKDGLLPTIEIYTTDSGSRVEMLLCHKREETTSNVFTQSTSPFILLSDNKVKYIFYKLA